MMNNTGEFGKLVAKQSVAAQCKHSSGVISGVAHWTLRGFRLTCSRRMSSDTPARIARMFSNLSGVQNSPDLTGAPLKLTKTARQEKE
eukprot:scaffold45005_cov19-Prasinocladus_malaysianus.AAC.1